MKKDHQDPYEVEIINFEDSASDDAKPLIKKQTQSKKKRNGASVDNNHDNEDLLAPLAKKPLTHHDFFTGTETGVQGANATCLLGFIALYGIHYRKPSYISMPILHIYSCGWNYLQILGNFIRSIYNIIEICRSHRDKKRKLVMEVASMATTLIFAGGTTLSLLANIHLLSGLALTICGPLGPVTAGFYTVFLGIIDLVNCYKISRQLKLENMLRDRLKRFARIDDFLEAENKDSNNRSSLSAYDRKDLEKERDAMREQFIAFARVGIKNKEITEQDLMALLNKPKLQKNGRPRFDRAELKEPRETDQKIVQLVRARLREKVRAYAYNGSFWIFVGVGSILLALTTLFPPLLIPAIALIAIGAIIKAVDILEIDKRIHNSIYKNKQKTIEHDNPLTNFLTRWDKEKRILADSLKQFEEQRQLDVVDHVINKHCKKRNKSFSDEYRTKMRIAYELTRHKHQGTEKQFYEQLLELPWWRRRKMLGRAMDIKVQGVTMTSPDYINVEKYLMQEDKKYFAQKQCRKEYGGLFIKKKTTSEDRKHPVENIGVSILPALVDN